MKKESNDVLFSKKTILIIILILLIVISIGVSFAFWAVTETQTKENVITTGCIGFEITDKTTPITLNESYPTSDDNGKIQTPYTFTLKNNCEVSTDFTISLERLSTSNLANNYIKAMLNEKGTAGTPKLLENYSKADKTYATGTSEGRVLLSGQLGPKSESTGTKEYELRLWIDSGAPNSSQVMEKTYTGKIAVNGIVGSNKSAAP